MEQEKEVYVLGLWECFGERSIYGVYTSKSKLMEGYRKIMEGDARCRPFSDLSDSCSYRKPYIYRFNVNEFMGERPEWNDGRLYMDETKYEISIEEVQEEKNITKENKGKAGRNSVIIAAYAGTGKTTLTENALDICTEVASMPYARILPIEREGSTKSFE